MKPSLVAAILTAALALVFAAGPTAAPTLEGQVTDPSGDPAEGAAVTLSTAGPAGTMVVNSTTTNETGRFAFMNVPNGTYLLDVTGDTGSSTDSTTITVRVFGQAEDHIEQDLSLRPPNAAPSAGLPVLFPMLLLGAAAVLLAALFARIRHNDLLQNAVRLRIMEHLRTNPGKHYRAVLTDLGLAMGVLSHHLNSLERGGYIASRQDGVYRRFYPVGMKTEVTLFLTDVQERIVLALRQRGGISQADLADTVGISRSLANYHLHILRDAGLVRLEARGRETGCFLVEGSSTP